MRITVKVYSCEVTCDINGCKEILHRKYTDVSAMRLSSLSGIISFYLRWWGEGSPRSYSLPFYANVTTMEIDLKLLRNVLTTSKERAIIGL